MLRLIIVLSIIAIIAIVLIAFIFRHEIETLAHKYGLRDDLKHFKHELKRKKNEFESLKNRSASMFDRITVKNEIDKLKKIIEDMENEKYE